MCRLGFCRSFCPDPRAPLIGRLANRPTNFEPLSCNPNETKLAEDNCNSEGKTCLEENALCGYVVELRRIAEECKNRNKALCPETFTVLPIHRTIVVPTHPVQPTASAAFVLSRPTRLHSRLKYTVSYVKGEITCGSR